jgi:hypothetical protein
MSVKINTYFYEVGSTKGKEHEEEQSFFDWNNCEIYLKNRISLKHRREFFVIEIGEQKISELDGNNFRKLEKVKEEFYKIFTNKDSSKIENAESKRVKSERIYVRYFPDEKEELSRKAKAENLTISEYIRQSSLSGKRVSISSDELKILNGSSINFNQFVKLMNTNVKSGDSISSETIENALKEWKLLALTFRNLIVKYDSTKPRNDSQDD